MNRLRIISIGLAITIGIAALAPAQLNAFDGAEDEYLYIVKYLFDNKSPRGDGDTNTNENADGFDSAELEYKDARKHKSNGDGWEEAKPRPRVKESYVPPTDKEGKEHPC